MAVVTLPRDSGTEITLTVAQFFWSVANLSFGLYLVQHAHRETKTITQRPPWFFIFICINLTLILGSDVIKVTKLFQGHSVGGAGEEGGTWDIVDTLLDTTAMCGHLLLSFWKFGGAQKVIWPVDIRTYNTFLATIADKMNAVAQKRGSKAWRSRASLSHTSGEPKKTFSYAYNHFLAILLGFTVIFFLFTSVAWTIAKLDPQGQIWGIPSDVVIGLFGTWFIIAEVLVLGIAIVGVTWNQKYMRLAELESSSNTATSTSKSSSPEKKPKISVRIPRAPSDKSFRFIIFTMILSLISTVLGLIIFFIFDGVIGIMVSSFTLRIHQTCFLYYVRNIHKWILSVAEATQIDLEI